MRPLNILITTGPTREYIDPVRFISNPSTGRMGLVIANASLRKAHKVTLISGPVYLEPPKGIEFYRVTSAIEMRDIVLKKLPSSDVFFACSAVCDYRPVYLRRAKIKKKKRVFNLKLTSNPDILKEALNCKKGKIFVGFALESENLIANALAKLKRKNLDIIVANEITPESVPFGNGKIGVVIINRDGRMDRYKEITKLKLAKILLDKVERICYTLSK